MSELSEKPCVPCTEGTPPLPKKEQQQLLSQLSEGWKVIQAHHLENEYHLKDFRSALAFVNQVGEIAESAGHHPDIFLTWGRVQVTIYTHKINGLSEADFVLAAKIDRLPLPRH